MLACCGDDGSREQQPGQTQSSSSTRAPATAALSDTERTTAEWLGRAYSGGPAPDLFFDGFWMSDAAFYQDSTAWSCIFEGVVRRLREPETQATLAEQQEDQ